MFLLIISSVLKKNEEKNLKSDQLFIIITKAVFDPQSENN